MLGFLLSRPVQTLPLMKIEIRQVRTQDDIRQFVDLPFRIYGKHPYWIPPLKKGEIDMLTPHHNPAWRQNDGQFWLALRDGKVVGRIGALINHPANEKNGEKMARFTRLELFEDQDVFEALMQTAIAWAKAQGMQGVHGPLGFSNLDSQGVLVEGFDRLPSVASVYHLPYYHRFLEAYGFQKEMDWLEFRLQVPRDVPDKVKKINELSKTRNGFRVVSYKRINDLLPHAREMFGLLNRAFEELFSVVPFDEALMDFYTNKYISMLNPKFIKLVYDRENKLAGFIIGVPSLSRAMQKARGSLAPFGWYHIMQALRNPKEADLFLTAVEPQYQGGGLTAILIFELQQSLLEQGVYEVETTGMLESNQKAIQNWKNFEHEQHKRKRCYRLMF